MTANACWAFSRSERAVCGGRLPAAQSACLLSDRCMSVCLSICLSVHCLSVCLSVCLRIVCPFVCRSVGLSICPNGVPVLTRASSFLRLLPLHTDGKIHHQVSNHSSHLQLYVENLHPGDKLHVKTVILVVVFQDIDWTARTA